LSQGLPAHWYFDPAHHAFELQAIWQRQWLCLGHAAHWPQPGLARSFNLGELAFSVTRDGHGNWHAQGPDGPLSLRIGHGFVFVRLAPQGAAFPAEDLQLLQAWPLETLALAHSETHTVACNWKIFWENYQECYHCPGAHPALCKLVPLYGEGVTRSDLLPVHKAARHDGPTLRPGAITWSADGATPLPHFPGLGEAERAAGMTFADFMPGMFLIAHVDYVRSVRVWPLGPERTALSVDWYLDPQVLATGEVDIERLVGFARQVVSEDARVCELNQGGLRSRSHQHGLLLPIEANVIAFDDWVRRQLDRAA
jgi:Rieske 2Fe-2S family protein